MGYLFNIVFTYEYNSNQGPQFITLSGYAWSISLMPDISKTRQYITTTETQKPIDFLVLLLIV